MPGRFAAWRGGNQWGGEPVRGGARSAHMNYVLALFLPPLSILLLGRIFLAVVVFVIWIPAIVFSGGLTHPMFVILAWILIYQDHADARG